MLGRVARAMRVRFSSKKLSFDYFTPSKPLVFDAETKRLLVYACREPVA